MAKETKQHRAVRRAIEEAGRPLSPAEILAAASRDVPGLGLATVYRNLKALTEADLIASVQLPGEPPRYETGRVASRHHHHFRCDDCGRVFDVPGCPAGLAALTPPGFALRDHDLVLYGRCAECVPGSP